VQTSASNAELNAENIKPNIARNAQRHVKHVPKNVEKWQLNKFTKTGLMPVFFPI
jgi:hypothetical protein